MLDTMGLVPKSQHRKLIATSLNCSIDLNVVQVNDTDSSYID